MSQDQKYNGWRNRETWLVSLWLGNEESVDSYWREAAESAKRQSKGCLEGFERTPQGLLADRLKDEIENGTDVVALTGSGLYQDLLYTALARVDWYEVAEAFLSPE